MFYIGHNEIYSGISTKTESEIIALLAFKEQFDRIYGDLENQIYAKTSLTNLKGTKQITFIHNPNSVKIWLNGSKLIKTTPDDTTFAKGDFYSLGGVLYFTTEFASNNDVLEIESEGLVELSTPQIQEQVPVGTSVLWHSTQPIPTGYIPMTGQTKEEIAIYPELLLKFPNGLPNVAQSGSAAYLVKAFSVLTGGGTKTVEEQLKILSELMMSATASSVPAGITALWTSEKAIPTGWLPLWGQTKEELAIYPVALRLYPDGFPDTRDNDSKFSTFYIVKIYDYAHMPEAADFSYIVQQMKPNLDILNYSGRLLGRPKVYTTSDTYTPSPQAKFLIVEVQGSGGGGGDATGTASTVVAGTSGSGGAYAKSHVTVTSGTAAIVVGTGGNANTAGGHSSFVGFGETIIANGGKAGIKNLGNVANNVSTVLRAVDGGTPTGGNITNEKGSCSQPTLIMNGTVLTGNGGDSHFSGGALGANAGENGSNGILGSGGSAAAVSYSATTKNGGKGGNGVVIIWEFA